MLARRRYLGSGVYEVLLTVLTPGGFGVALELGGAQLTRLTGVAICAQGREPTPDGRSCGCPRGARLQLGECSLCPAGYSTEVGDTECTRCDAVRTCRINVPIIKRSPS
eukprot:7247137-Prymnesium_polylepis.2